MIKSLNFFGGEFQKLFFRNLDYHCQKINQTFFAQVIISNISCDAWMPYLRFEYSSYHARTNTHTCKHTLSHAVSHSQTHTLTCTRTLSHALSFSISWKEKKFQFEVSIRLLFEGKKMSVCLISNPQSFVNWWNNLEQWFSTGFPWNPWVRKNMFRSF